MATNRTYTVAYRRKREGKTDYKKRIKMLSGNRPRLVVRKSLKHISLQLIEYHQTGDKIIASAHSQELKKHGWKAGTGNTSAAYLTGMLLAKKAKKKIDCVLDIGQYTSVKGCILYAAAAGAAEGGLQVPFAKEIAPSMNRIRGEQVAAYAKLLKANKDKYQKQFSAYVKANFDPETLPSHFDQVKKTIGAQ
jgi:large subunit ribosomal protein L18